MAYRLCMCLHVPACVEGAASRAETAQSIQVEDLYAAVIGLAADISVFRYELLGGVAASTRAICSDVRSRAQMVWRSTSLKTETL